MLLELALLGSVDVPLAPRWRWRDMTILLVGAEGGRNAALNGGLERLRAFAEPVHPRSAALRLAPYVGAMMVPSVGAGARRATVRRAILDGAADIRTALLVWMLKQDHALGGPTFALLFPRPARRTGRRALRRASPDLYAFGDRDVAAAAHRVLFAVIVQPPTAMDSR